MNYIKNLSLLSIFLFSLISCGKDDSGSSNATNTCSSNYLPYKTGTVVYTNSGTKNDSMVFLKDTTIDGIKFYEIKSDANTTGVRAFMGRDASGNVWTFNTGAPLPGGGAFLPSKYVMLYPNKAVNDTWSHTITMNLSGFEYKYAYKMKMLERNIKATVAGTNYTDGLRFSMETSFSLGGFPSSSETLEYTYLCGLGLYQSKVGSTVTTTTKIKL